MSKILIFDGAMGTMLQQRGLLPGQSPEELNLTMPDVVESVHADYLQAGADIVTTNTFGGSRFKLREYDLDEKVAQINQRAVEIARAACQKAGHGKVAASLGPTGYLCRRWGIPALMKCIRFIGSRPMPLPLHSPTIFCWKPSVIWGKPGRRCWPVWMPDREKFRLSAV